MTEIEPRLSKYFHSKAARFGVPLAGTFELTRRCNFNCKMCYVHTNDTSKDVELTADEWLKIAADARDAGMLYLLLTGGEPLIRQDFPYLYTELSRMGLVISINTNASLIDDKIFDLFKEYPPYRVNISLYGASDDIYESLCGNRKFSKVSENIKRLKEMEIGVRLNCILNQYNVEDTEKIYEVAKELNVFVKFSSYNFPPMRIDGTTGYNQARLTPSEAAKNTILCRKLTYPIEALRSQADMYMKMDGADCDDLPAEGSGVRCRAGRSSFWVNFDGTMSPCGMMTSPVTSLKDKSFKEAWDIIRSETAAIRLPAECEVCKNKDACGVCAAMCVTETGFFNKKPEYLCEMTEEIVRLYKKEFLSDL